MVTKRKARRKTRRSKKEPSWEDMGAMMAKKLEKEHGSRGSARARGAKPRAGMWSWCNGSSHGSCCSGMGFWKPRGNFLGALIFGIIGVYILHSQGIVFDQVSFLMKALFILAFAWMLS